MKRVLPLELIRPRSPVGFACFPLIFVLGVFVSCLGAQEPGRTFEDLALHASAAREQNDIPRAIDLYTQAVRMNPKWSDGWWFLGSMQYGADQYAPARDALTRFLELTPNAGPALALRGLCEFEIKEYAQSLKDIQQALSLGAANKSRNETILRYHEALLLTRLGRFEEALQRFGVLAKGAPPNQDLFVAIGLAGLRNPLLPTEIAPDQVDLYAAAGEASFEFMTAGAEKSKSAFQNVFLRFPRSVNAHYLYGYLLFAIQPDQAVSEFKRELEVDPSNAVAQAMIAWDSLLQSDAAAALPYAQKAAALAPGLTVAQLVLGRSLLDTGNINAGMDHLEKALQAEPGNVEIHLALVKAYSELGRKEDARRERLLCLQMSNDQRAHP